MNPKFINVNFWTKKIRENAGKKIGTPKIDAFF